MFFGIHRRLYCGLYKSLTHCPSPVNILGWLKFRTLKTFLTNSKLFKFLHFSPVSNYMSQYTWSCVFVYCVQDHKDKRKLDQRLLVLILHAQNCQGSKEGQLVGGREDQPCANPLCGTVKAVLDHVDKCQNGHKCSCKYSYSVHVQTH